MSGTSTPCVSKKHSALKIISVKSVISIVYDNYSVSIKITNKLCFHKTFFLPVGNMRLRVLNYFKKKRVSVKDKMIG